MKKNEKGAAFVNGVIEIGTEPLFLILTTVFTIASGVCVNFFEQESVLYKVCDRGFYISLSLILVQLMLQLFDVRRGMGNLQERISSEDNVIFPKNASDVNKSMQDALSNPRASHVKIICYGTSKYGKIIDQIIDQYYNISQLDIIVCSPDCELFSPNESDSVRIRQMLSETYAYFSKENEKVKKKRKINLYCSLIPPTIRASVVYDIKGNPMFCTCQSYYIFLGEGTLFRGQVVSPALLAQDEHSSILGELTLAFEKEFDRLLNSSKKYSGESANG